MLTCAPVSTRKLSLLMRSVMCSMAGLVVLRLDVVAGWGALLCITFGGTSELFVSERLDCGVNFGSGNSRVTGKRGVALKSTCS